MTTADAHAPDSHSKRVKADGIGLKAKLIAMMLAVGIIPLIAATVIIEQMGTQALETQALVKLESVREAKRKQVETYFEVIRDQITTLAESTMVVSAMGEFSNGFSYFGPELTKNADTANEYRDKLRDYYRSQFGREYEQRTGTSANVDAMVPVSPAAVASQYHFIASNPHPLGAKEQLVTLEAAGWDMALYAGAHAKYHPPLRSFLRKFGFYDIFLVEPEGGHVVYSVFKELDFGTSLNEGPYRDSNFARAYREAANMSRPGEAVLVDFEPYRPSYEAPASFMATPIFSGDKLAGVLVFQMPADRINAIVQDTTGLGETGESILVGADSLMRSQSRFSDEPAVLNTKVDSEPVRNALAGNAGAALFTNAEGVEVLSAYTPLEIADIDWALNTSIHASEALASVDKLIYAGTITAVVAIPLILLIAWLFTRGLYRELGSEPSRLRAVAESIANGDLDVDLGNDGKPSMGVFSAMATMRDNLRTRLDEDRRVAAENGRIKQALDNVTNNVMVADADHNIIYMNGAANSMFSNAEAAFRKEMPDFDASTLIGSNIDIFHKDPSHQRQMLAKMTDTLTSGFKIGGRNIAFKANPIMEADGTRLGTVVEWADRTQEAAVEDEVNRVVAAGRSGNLGDRLTLDGKEGFLLALSTGLNELLDVTENAVNDSVSVMSAVSGGHLDKTMGSDYKGAFAQLAGDTNATINKLTEVIGEVQTAAGAVHSGADEITRGTTDLGQRTEEQASSLEETAASMEEMTSTVKQNADNADQANQLALGAREQAEKGGEVVSQAVDAMAEINDSSKKIADIISVIDEIAFQTNLLALNAAVEAARAGEQGRGFAVVASEVRNLAQRSATAAKEIKDLIEDSVSKVGEGSRLVDESGETLSDIVVAVKKVSDIVAEIAAASREQSAGIEQVNQAVMQLDEMTQQNAALVEEATAASRSMADNARSLNHTMSFFKGADGEVDYAAGADPDYAGPERRGDARPWTAEAAAPPAPAPAAAPASAPPPPRRAASGSSDDEWDEF